MCIYIYIYRCFLFEMEGWDIFCVLLERICMEKGHDRPSFRLWGLTPDHRYPNRRYGPSIPLKYTNSIESPYHNYPLVICYITIEHGQRKFVSFPINSLVIVHNPFFLLTPPHPNDKPCSFFLLLGGIQ